MGNNNSTRRPAHDRDIVSGILLCYNNSSCPSGRRALQDECSMYQQNLKTVVGYSYLLILSVQAYGFHKSDECLRIANLFLSDNTKWLLKES
jgi:hypothetical protein